MGGVPSQQLGYDDALVLTQVLVAFLARTGSCHRLSRAANQSSGSGLSGGKRRSTCRNTSQATPALMPAVQSLRSSSTIDTVLAPMRRPRNRKRPSCSGRDVGEMAVGLLQQALSQFHAGNAWL